MKISDHLKNLVKRIPHSPGVYQYYDKNNVIIYVGKAKNLKKRVSSYFTKNHQDSGKTRILVSKIVDIKFIVVATEMDALLLENSLIKKYQPRYNILLKDDKTYPSITIKNERFPRIHSTRQIIKNGSEYFGPYASLKSMRTVLDLIHKLYPIRNCNYNLSEENIQKGKFKACLEYHIGNCKAPCVGKQSLEEYNQNVDEARQIIKGNMTDLLREMKKLMKKYAENLEFEKAQEIKEKIEDLIKFKAKTTIVNYKINNVDVFSIVSDEKSGFVNYLKINEGSIVHSLSIEIKKKLDESDTELLRHAIVNTREKFGSQSQEIFVPFELDLQLEGVKFHVPQRGDKKKLLEMSERNARYYMRDKHKQQEMVDPEAHQNRIMKTLQRDLKLQELPRHIECFDNSNIQGTNPSSACVVFKNAKPAKKDYRKFNIKTVVGPDDFASMEEVVYRRYKRLQDENQPMPQLIIIDGGKGQLSSALKALEKINLRGKIAIIGIAKKLEEIFFPGDSLPIYLDKRSESLKLIQHLRNEAHRFSLSHHRNRRSKEALRSELTEITGVGFRTAQQLLWKFKSVSKIKEASEEELREAVNARVAKAVWKFYN